jgi:hypothetical protein
MKLLSTALGIAFVAAAPAHAQTFEDVQIRLGLYTLKADGGEQPLGIWRSTGPVVIGKSTPTTVSWNGECEGFGISSVKGDTVDKAAAAWLIDVTPIRVVATSVTFKLRSTKVIGLRQQLDQAANKPRSSQPPDDEIELTLRPGESWPVDQVALPPGGKTMSRGPCAKSASIRVSVDPEPWEGEERRLVAADLWLIERGANGREAQRTQPLSVRGLPNHATPFFFDRIVEANVPVDVYGTITPRLDSGTIAVAIEVRSRWGNPGDKPGFAGPQRSVKSEVQLKPAEIVDVQLPAFDNDAGPFARRQFSLRIRARQLR